MKLNKVANHWAISNRYMPDIYGSPGKGPKDPYMIEKGKRDKEQAEYDKYSTLSNMFGIASAVPVALKFMPKRFWLGALAAAGVGFGAKWLANKVSGLSSLSKSINERQKFLDGVDQTNTYLDQKGYGRVPSRVQSDYYYDPYDYDGTGYN